MKKLKLVTVVALGALISAGIFTACKKDGVDSVMLKSQKSLSQNMRTFTSMEELYAEIENVISLDEQELKTHEEAIGFCSFGRMAESIYYPIVAPIDENDLDFTPDQANEHIAEHPEYLELVLDEEGDYEFLPKYDGNIFRYVMNEDRMFQVGDTIFKVFKNAVIAASTADGITALFAVTEENIENAIENPIFHVLYQDIRIHKGNYGKSQTLYSPVASNGKERVKVEYSLILETWLPTMLIYQCNVLVRAQSRANKNTSCWTICTRTLNTDYSLEATIHQLKRTAGSRYTSSRPELKYERLVIPKSGYLVSGSNSINFVPYCYISKMYGRVWIATTTLSLARY